MIKKVLCGILSSVLVCTLVVSPVCAIEDNSEKSGKVTWEELEDRIRTGNLSSQALDENISSIELIDYDSMYYSLKKQINEIGVSQSYLADIGDFESLNTLNASVASLRNTYEDIQDGKLQRDSEDAVNQLHNAQNQVVAAGQSLYINILAMEQSLRDGERGVEALDRGLVELHLRRSLGQVSDRAVEEMERTREDTVSGLNTLGSTISACKAQLQFLMGETPTGELELGELPEVTGDELYGLDCDADLIAAKEKNFEVSNAALALEKAEDELEDAEDDYRGGSIKKYQLTQAQHSRDAAELTYLSAVQRVEFSFRELYRSIEDCLQVWENKVAAADYQQKQLKIAEKQYELGRTSYFALMTAKDNAESAVSAAESAARDMFSAVTEYHTAVEFGIMN